MSHRPLKPLGQAPKPSAKPALKVATSGIPRQQQKPGTKLSPKIGAQPAPRRTVTAATAAPVVAPRATTAAATPAPTPTLVDAPEPQLEAQATVPAAKKSALPKVLTLVGVLALAAAGVFVYQQQQSANDAVVEALDAKSELTATEGADEAKPAAKKKRPSKKAGPYTVARKKASNLPALNAKELSSSLAAATEAARELMPQIPAAEEKALHDYFADDVNFHAVMMWKLLSLDAEAQKTTSDQNKKDSEQRDKLRAEIKDLQEQAKTLGRDTVAPQLKTKRSQLDTLNKKLALPASLGDMGRSDLQTELLAAITQDVDWLNKILFTGTIAQPAKVFGLIDNIAAENNKILSNDMGKEIATATALEFTHSNWDPTLAPPRAEYYFKNWQAGRLNTIFDRIPFWQRRMVCGCKGDNEHGTVSSLQWSLDNGHIPADKYPGSCWRAGYHSDNLFGDSIHGHHYYQPWAGLGDNRQLKTKTVGGVCGGLSHFGAFSALANGVPAATMGEPGHCAFFVLVNGEWWPAYSLHWNRGLHWAPWRGMWKYVSLMMADELHKGHNEAKNRTAFGALSLAEMLRAEEAHKAIEYYKMSLRIQPLNLPTWWSYADFLTSIKATKAQWQAFNAELCNLLAVKYPEIAAILSMEKLYPALAEASDKDKLALIRDFWRATKDFGPLRWDVDNFLNKQTDFYAAKDEDKICQLYDNIVKVAAKKEAYAPIVIAWGSNRSDSFAAEKQQQVMESTLAAIGSIGDGAGNRDALVGQVMLAAAKMRDMKTFQSLGKLLSDKYREPRLPAFEPFPGRLASQGGLLLTSSTCKHDAPSEHWGVLEPTGGRFHTDKDTDAWAMVEMPRTVYTTGIVIIGSSGNRQRLSNVKVQVSETGNDDDWQDVHQFEGNLNYVNRVDLGSTKPRARYVRILRPGGPDFFHLFGIFVYGDQAS